MKSILAVLSTLLVLGFYAQAGDQCPTSCAHPATYCQPVAAHVVHCHTTSCGYPCVTPCGYACVTSCMSPRAYACNHVHVANRPYCRPAVRVVVRRHCLPRSIFYRTCYTACGW